MRVRREAKILKNHYRELTWKTSVMNDDEFCYPVSRYKPNRVWLARCRIIKACRRRYYNEARRQRRQGERGNYEIHQANRLEIENEAYEWWNIK